LWVFGQVGARLLHALTHGTQWRYGTFDVHCHSEGSYVVLPPSPGVRWLAVPDPTRRALPEADAVIGTITHTCGQLTRTAPTSRGVPGAGRTAAPRLTALSTNQAAGR